MPQDNILAIYGGAPTRKKFLVFGSPKIGKEEIKEVVHTLKTGWLGTGPKVTKFEQMVADYTGAKYAIALNSATAGMHLSLIACGVKSGDEVITTPMTFAATANVVEHIGAKPVFADIDISSMNIDPKQVEQKITKKTKAIIPVHMAGRPCDMTGLKKLAKAYNLKIIEDAAHAFGAKYKNKKIGAIGDTSCFSFYVTKNLITGEGGMVTTNDKKIAESVRVYSLHGMSRDAWKRYSDSGFKHYLIEVPGFKYNMMDLQAAIGIHQLNAFDANQTRRKEVWDFYNKSFKDLPLVSPAESEKDTVHAYHLYTILVDVDKLKATREEIQKALHAENIGLGIHFIALHLHPYYRNKYNLKRGDFPQSEFVSDRTISLPFSAKLTNKDAKDVVNAVKKVLNYFMENNGRKRRNTKLPKGN